VLNNCTLVDANRVGLNKIITDNGTAIAGTVFNKISPETKSIIDTADLIVLKGQGNFETLHHSGKIFTIYFYVSVNCFLNILVGVAI